MVFFYYADPIVNCLSFSLHHLGWVKTDIQLLLTRCFRRVAENTTGFPTGTADIIMLFCIINKTKPFKLYY